MLKALKSCLIILSSIILLSTNSYAITKKEFLHTQEDNIIKLCEDFNDKRQATLKNNPFAGRYECGLTAFYALHKVMEIITTTERGSDDREFLEELMVKYYIDEYETYNFIYIHLDFERYLEEGKDKRQY